MRGALIDLKKWMRPEPIDKTLVTIADNAFSVPEPFGVTLILCPWNYLVHLLLLPLVGAIAAGNCTIIKSSDLTSSLATFFADIMP
jgi:acyl-CoA reductase-like NAD-dependent aldehyde dehydrogenase